jgi:hypothetical protein
MEQSNLDKLKLAGARLGVFAATLWLVFIADRILPGDFNQWGIIPRRLDGIWGILISPFLHANLGHLLSNFIPLMILMAILGNTARWLVDRGSDRPFGRAVAVDLRQTCDACRRERFDLWTNCILDGGGIPPRQDRTCAGRFGCWFFVWWDALMGRLANSRRARVVGWSFDQRDRRRLARLLFGVA